MQSKKIIILLATSTLTKKRIPLFLNTQVLYIICIFFKYIELENLKTIFLYKGFNLQNRFLAVQNI